MTREDLKKIVEGITDEQLKSILDLHSSGIGKAKADGEKYKTELDTANKRIETITAELDGLKESNASAEDWKAKYEEFKATVDAEKAEAKRVQLEAEKRANLEARFEAAKNGKNLRHISREEYYLKKFAEEIEKPERQGKINDIDLLMELTKEDAEAWEGGNTVTVNMAGAKPVGTQTITGKDFAKMGYKDRVNLFNTNKPLYDELSGNSNNDTE